MSRLAEVTESLCKQQQIVDRLKEEKAKFNDRQQLIQKQIDLLKETKGLFKKEIGLWAHNIETM